MTNIDNISVLRAVWKNRKEVAHQSFRNWLILILIPLLKNCEPLTSDAAIAQLACASRDQVMEAPHIGPFADATDLPDGESLHLFLINCGINSLVFFTQGDRLSALEAGMDPQPLIDPQLTYAGERTFTLTYRDPAGCLHADAIMIQPNFSFIAGTTVCVTPQVYPPEHVEMKSAAMV